ncbi:rCG28946 [Rattus norvegicus]|uniref:RCG28946 n=1 Tax=Rattus norvegicus TaxID=10116 RepID=A6HUS3_RAT|nr:rCG28946 [Rattus norvegicus]
MKEASPEQPSLRHGHSSHSAASLGLDQHLKLRGIGDTEDKLGQEPRPLRSPLEAARVDLEDPHSLPKPTLTSQVSNRLLKSVGAALYSQRYSPGSDARLLSTIAAAITMFTVDSSHF